MSRFHPSFRCVVLTFLTLLPLQAQGSFCTEGINSMELVEDNDQASVEVIVVQAPLLSTNKKIGQKLGWFGMYHSAVVFRQDGGKSYGPSYWTLEFEFVAGSMMKGLMPAFNGSQLVWNNDAKFCLTEGILWGREHWTKSFDVLYKITARQLQALMQEMVLPVNSTAHGQKPQYQAFRVERTPGNGVPDGDVLISDVTCSQGVSWVLHFFKTSFNLDPPAGYFYRATVGVMHADSIEPVNTTNAVEWAKVLRYYSSLTTLLGPSDASALEKFWDAFEVIRHEYVYDTNAEVYFKIQGNSFPWFHPKYVPVKIEAAPKAKVNISGAFEVKFLAGKDVQIMI
mmetsp:Transcript_27019/g.58823  ORF Transcript_27019/g.58823 Transcript_27019/m.58823 type:complete len:340 (+) Transcript_27019:24-1043(+)